MRGNSVAKLLLENEHLCKEINHVKHVFKDDQFDSIKKTRVRTKEQSDSFIDKLNLKSAENEDLKAYPPNFKLKCMFKLHLDPLAPRLLQNREAHIDYLKYTKEQADILWGIELLVYARDTCPSAIKLNAKNVCVTPKNNVKKVSNCGSKPTSNKRNDRISQTLSRNMKNKVEAHPRKVNKKNRVVEPIHDVDVKHSLLNVNSIYVTSVLNLLRNIKNDIWKPAGHVFTEVGLKWKPTGKTFTIVGNSCPLTRITSANVLPPKKTTSLSVETQKPEHKVYSGKPKNVKNVGSSKKAKIVESKKANHLEPNHTWGSNATDIPSSSSLVMTGCPDCSLVSGLRMFETHDREPLSAHELCVDLLSGSQDTNLYTISLDDMHKTSPICLLSKALKTKSLLWHRRLSHLNFGILNKLAKDGLARGILRLKF
ncbi:retrovirus-related pol polyprotein from transposon TNT 1-94 [Tanacetum coccineum]